MTHTGSITAVPGVASAIIEHLTTGALVATASTVSLVGASTVRYSIVFPDVALSNYRLILKDSGGYTIGIIEPVQFTTGAWVELDDNPAPTGSGARTVVITVKLQSDDSLVPNALVRLTAGPISVYGTTGQNGQVTFNVDDNTFTVAITGSNINFAGASLSVAANITQQYYVTQVSVPSIPSDPDICFVDFYLWGDQAEGVGYKVVAEVETLGCLTNSHVVTNTKHFGVSDSNGHVRLSLIKHNAFTRGGVYTIDVFDARGNKRSSRRCTVPAVAQINATQLTDVT